MSNVLRGSTNYYVGSFTPITGGITTNIEAQGGNYWRQADRMYVNAALEFSGVNTDGIVTMSIPGSLTINTSRIFNGFTVSSDWLTVGNWTIRDANTGVLYDGPVVYDIVSVGFRLGYSNASGLVRTDTNIPITIADGDILSYQYSVPITEWS